MNVRRRVPPNCRAPAQAGRTSFKVSHPGGLKTSAFWLTRSSMIFLSLLAVFTAVVALRSPLQLFSGVDLTFDNSLGLMLPYFVICPIVSCCYDWIVRKDGAKSTILDLSPADNAFLHLLGIAGSNENASAPASELLYRSSSRKLSPRHTLRPHGGPRRSPDHLSTRARCGGPWRPCHQRP